MQETFWQEEVMVNFGKPYENRDGVALEPQFLPNSMNIEKKPRVILRKGEEYEAVTTYRFETE